MLCYYEDDIEKYKRLSRWEDNIKMDLKEIVVDKNWMEGKKHSIFPPLHDFKLSGFTNISLSLLLLLLLLLLFIYSSGYHV